MEKEKIIKISNKNIKKVLDENKKDITGFHKREISKLINSNKNNVVIGLRRIGKTQLLKEIIKSLYNSNELLPQENKEDERDEEIDISIDNKSIGVSDFRTSDITLIQNKILYLKLDSIDFEVLTMKEKNDFLINLRDLVVNGEYLLLLLDEVQAIPHWAKLLKDIIDENSKMKPLRFIATGSNSNELIEKNEHGIDRWSNLIFGIPSFDEMEVITNKDLSLSSYIDWEHFPSFSKDEYDELVYDFVIEKAFASTKHNKATLLKVLKSTVKHIGQEVNPNKISSDSGINKTHMKDYIFNLERAQLVFKLNNFHDANSNFKLISLIPSLFRLFIGSKFEKLSNEEKGHLFENFVIIQILNKLTLFSSRVDLSYYRNKEGEEIDLVLKNFAIEIKYKKDININDLRKYASIAKKISLSTLIIIYCGKTQTERTIDGIKVKVLNWKDIKNVKWW